MCKDIIFSRTRHDYRSCSCGEVSIDGGHHYVKICFKTKMPVIIDKFINVTEQELYDDWNYRKNKFGLIKEKANKKRIDSSKRKK
jgi:hypothetical protein